MLVNIDKFRKYAICDTVEITGTLICSGPFQI